MLDKKMMRRIALNQQGLLKPHSFGQGKAATLKAIEQIGYVQIDTISVVERAHHHVVSSRVKDYQPEFLAHWVSERKLFEYWFHAAAWLPMRDYRFALPRMNAIKAGNYHWIQHRDLPLQKQILARITQEGPLKSRDFKQAPNSSNGWWDWKPAKQALEQLFMQGDLMVTRREGFQKVYDLRERVLPSEVNTTEPTLAEFASHLLDTSLRAHGFVTPKMITYLRKGPALRKAVTEEIAARMDANELVSTNAPSGSLVYMTPEIADTAPLRASATVRILSPFDNVLIQRERVREVFDFDYQIECYTPASKRKFGYFCLPILYRDQLIGRIDCKAHRKEQHLEIKAAYIEGKVDASFPEAMDAALHHFSKMNHCQHITGDRNWHKHRPKS
ncbi:crosslink repair DNA glycosylase YcaQ family protein [Kiritimatiellota bacterium B12222]|nr:crosslink repair DNA glycosylase YcaQ family protein [Kiritimatiellota bacterium B12222]